MNINTAQHYLNSIKRSILAGTSKTSIEMSIKDGYTLERLKEDVIPSGTLQTLGKGELGEVNAKFEELTVWVGKMKEWFEELVKGGLKTEDVIILNDELDGIVDELIKGDITALPYGVLKSYLDNGYTFDASLISEEGMVLIKGLILENDKDAEWLAGLRVACNWQELSTGGTSFQSPFPITYMVFAEITEVNLLRTTEQAPNVANELRARLGMDFKEMLASGQMTLHQRMGLYRILGPEATSNKATLEVNNNTNITNQQIVVVKDKAKLAPDNLVIGENGDLLGVGSAFGNINKSNLLKLAAGEGIQPPSQQVRTAERLTS